MPSLTISFSIMAEKPMFFLFLFFSSFSTLHLESWPGANKTATDVLFTRNFIKWPRLEIKWEQVTSVIIQDSPQYSTISNFTWTVLALSLFPIISLPLRWRSLHSDNDRYNSQLQIPHFVHNINRFIFSYYFFAIYCNIWRTNKILSVILLL